MTTITESEEGPMSQYLDYRYRPTTAKRIQAQIAATKAQAEAYELAIASLDQTLRDLTDSTVGAPWMDPDGPAYGVTCEVFNEEMRRLSSSADEMQREIQHLTDWLARCGHQDADAVL